MPHTVSDPIRLPTRRPSALGLPAELGLVRRENGLTPLAFPDGHVGRLVTDYATVRAVLADPRFSARQELHHHAPYDHPFGTEPIAPAQPGLFIGMDPPEHTRYRKLLAGQFTARRVKQLVPRIEEIVESRLDALEAAGPGADLVEEFAVPIPTMMICELLGIPYSARDRFRAETETFFSLESSREEADGAYANLYEYLRGLVPQKRAEPGDDLLCGLIDGDELSDEEIAVVALVVLIAGHETTSSMLSLGAFALLTHPDQLAALRDDPSLTEGAVEEMLRFLPLSDTGVMRTALEDVDLPGGSVKAGECLVLQVSAANRDPERFDGDLDRLDVRRRSTGHLAFGHGVHQCLGAQLARIELQVAYPALLSRFPGLRLAVPADEVPLRSDMAIYGVHRLPVTW